MPAHHAAILQYPKLWMVNKMKNKRIPVNFVVTDRYDTTLDTFTQKMGDITLQDLDFLMFEFSDSKNSSNTRSCATTMSLEHRDTVNYGPNPFHNRRSRSLEISNIFYFDYTTPKCERMKRSDYTCTEQKMAICCKNLKNGKCCDEFIRNTLGAILFPQHYGKQK